jgi:hypothetical protein
MHNRIPPTHYYPVYTPKGYKETDFVDIIADLKTRSSFGIEKGNITIRIFSKGEYFERFGKQFYVHIFSAFGQVHISITEVTDDKTLQGLIQDLEEQIRVINKQLIEAELSREKWVKRCITRKTYYKEQKRQIRQLLQKQGIIIKIGSPLSKLLRLDNIPR